MHSSFSTLIPVGLRPPFRALLTMASFAGLAHVADGLPAPAGYSFANDCFIECARFHARFEQTHPGEQSDFVVVTKPDGLQHSVAVFSFRGRLHLWEQALGAFPLGLAASALHDPQVAVRAQHVFNRLLIRAEKFGAPRLRFRPPPAGEPVLEYLHLIHATLPSALQPVLFEAHDEHGRQMHFLTFISKGRFAIYTPEFGSITFRLPPASASSANHSERASFVIAAVNHHGSARLVSATPLDRVLVAEATPAGTMPHLSVR